MSVYRIDRDPAFFNKLSQGCLPGLLGRRSGGAVERPNSE